jgi:hypothetical protein
VDIFWAIFVASAFVFAFSSAFRRGADDTSWELHWGSLDAERRARIVTVAHSRDARARLTTPEDRALVAGYTRRRRRRRGYVDLAAASILALASALALAGLMGTKGFGIAGALFVLVTGTWEYLSEKQMNGRLRAVVEAERSTAQ